LLRQAKEFAVKVVALSDETAAFQAESQKHRWGLSDLEILKGQKGIEKIATLGDADIVLHAIPGFAGIRPLLAALESGKKVAFAGKESLVSAGQLIAPYLEQDRYRLIPVDSEHSAILQCLVGENYGNIEELVLTASGGAFRDLSLEEMKNVTPTDALKHPTWRMGPKVTVDSASLFNKTLEVVEAHYLFAVEYEKIKVVIHRESIVHSMVTFKDGSTKAQLSKPDMRLAIAYALNFPDRGKKAISKLDPVLGSLTFQEPDFERFPCLKLGYEAGKMGGTALCVLSYADEMVVKAFLGGKIGFLDIYPILRKVLDTYEPRRATGIEVLEREVRWAERKVTELLSDFKRGRYSTKS